MGIENARPTVVSTEGSESVLDYGRAVVLAGADALTALAGVMDNSFTAAVNLLVRSRHHLVVTGMGKSGHVARKIAATFSATSTPAIFVHPAEAAHGDLGVLTPGSVLLALSNSGRTPELEAILAHAQRLGLPIIAVASKADSPLMKQATVPLLLPDKREACPANIAPTTSTAMMMSLGDALAIATMRARGYTTAGLQELHPGGQIGARARAVSLLMHVGHEMPLVGPNEAMHEVILTMTSKSFGVAGVVEGNRLVGVITDGDLRRHAKDLMLKVASEVMTHDPVMIDVDTKAVDALALLNQLRITTVFVSDGERRPLGILHLHDLLRLGLF